MAYMRISLSLDQRCKPSLKKIKAMAYLSKKLVTLMVDAPITIDLDKAKLQDGVTPEFTAMLRKLEFKVLLRQVEAAIPKEELAKAEASTEELEAAQLVSFMAMDFATVEPRVLAMSPEAH